MAINKDVNYQVNVDKGREGGVESLRRAQQVADNFETSLSQATREAKQLDRALDSAGSSSRGLSGAASGINTQRLGGGVERVLSGLGAGELSNLVGLVGDIGDVTEALGGGLKGALSALVSPLGVVSAGIFAFTSVLALLTQELQKTEAAYQDALANLRTDINNEIAATLTARRALAEGGRKSLEDIRAKAEDELAILESVFADYVTVLSDTTLSEDIRNQFADALAETVTSIENTRKALSVYDAALISQQATQADARDAAEAATAKLKELISGGIDTLTGAVNQADDALSVFTKTMGDAKAAADAAEKSFTDMQTAAQEAVDSLDAQQAELSRELQSTIADLNADLIEAQTDANAEIAKAQSASYASRLKAEQDYQKEASRAEQDFRRDVNRIRRDAAADERQAIQENDIAAVLEVREGRKQQVADTRDAFKQERQRRAEDYADRRAVEEAALAARIADIQAARNEEVAAINAEITAARAAHAESITEIKRLRDGEIDRVRAVALANQSRYAAEEAAIARITGQLATAPASTGGGVIPFTGPQSTAGGGGLFNGLSANTAASGVNVIIQSLNLGEIATPGGVSSAIMNLTELFARAFQQLRVGA